MSRKSRKKTERRPRTPELSSGGRALVLSCFFLSGATSLVLQVAWSKMLAVVLGSSLYAISTVVAAYMAGLGLGSFIGGRFADRIRSRLRFYGFVEGWVGVFGLLSPFLFFGLEPVFRLLYDAGGAAGPMLLARFAVLFLVMMVPTLAMGCTLPMLVAFLQGHDPRFGRHVGRLYAINTLGAVAGTWTAGFALIPALGLRATVITAGLVNLGILAAILMARLPEPGAEPRPAGEGAGAEESGATPGDTPAPVTAWTARVVLALFAVSGALALTYEIAWTRVLSVVLGSSTYSFSTILGIYLLGVGAGSLVVSRWIGRFRQPVLVLGVLQGALGLSVFAGTFLVTGLGPRYATLLLGALDPEHGVAAAAVFRGSVLLAASIVLLPSLLLGAIFPATVAVVHRARGDAGASVGRAYALNTVGTIAGSLLTGFVLLEVLGTQRTLLWAAAGTFAVAAVLVGLSTVRVSLRAGGAAALVLAAVVVVVLPRPWDPARTNAGLSRILRTIVFQNVRVDPEELRLPAIIYSEEGRQASVAVTEAEGSRTLWVSGKADASSVGDLSTQVMLGQVPVLLAEDPRDVLVIGYGAGVTSGSVLTHPVERVETLEIEPAVIRAASYFNDVSGDPLSDPRHRVVIEDGRTWLQYSGRSYDVIISEPSNPWIAGIGNLFTRDFYERARDALNEGGVFCQWLQLYELEDETAWSIVRAFLDAFGSGELFLVQDSGDALLVTRKGFSSLGHDYIRDRIAPEAVAADLARVGVENPFDFALNYRGSLGAFLPATPGPVNTDDNAYVEFRAPRDLFSGSRFTGFDIPIGIDPIQPLLADLDRGTFLAGMGTALARAGHLSEAEQLEAIMRREDLPQIGDLREGILDVIGFPAELRDVFGLLSEAHAARGRKDHETALRLLEQASRRVPDNPHIEFRQGLELLALGTGERSGSEDMLRRAWDLFNRALAREPADDDYPAYVNLGLIQCARGKLEAGLFFFEEARKLDPDRGDAYLFAGRALRDLGENDRALQTFRDGFSRSPGHQGLRAELGIRTEVGGTHGRHSHS